MAYLHCEITSKALRAVTSVNLILPQDADFSYQNPEPNRGDLPALYLLHGRSHNYSVWQRYSTVELLAEKYHVAVVMPEVGRSFYTDMEYGQDCLAYVTKELPLLCQSLFHISPDPKKRFIAGMSMGGYGCLKAAFSCPISYEACAAFSAVTDIQTQVDREPEISPKKNEYRAVFGLDLKIKPKDDLFLLSSLTSSLAQKPRIFLACGTEDHLYDQNMLLHGHLKQIGYEHEYRQWPGIHDWFFWNEAIVQAFDWMFGGK